MPLALGMRALEISTGCSAPGRGNSFIIIFHFVSLLSNRSSFFFFF